MGYGFSYQYRRFAKNFAVTFGLTNRRYTGNVDLKGFRDSIAMKDNDANAYYFHQNFESKEKNEVNYLEISVIFNYMKLISKQIDFVMGIGASYGIPTLQRTAMTGYYNRSLNFYDYNVLIDEDQALNLGTYSNFIQPAEKVFKSSISALFEIGFHIYLSPQLTFNTKLTATYGLTNIQNKPATFIQHESYSGLVSSDKVKVNNLFLGVEFGIAFHMWDLE